MYEDYTPTISEEERQARHRQRAEARRRRQLERRRQLLYKSIPLAIIAVIGATPYPTRWMNRLSEGPKTGRVLAVAAPVALMALLAVVTAYLVDGSFNPFLYFRF